MSPKPAWRSYGRVLAFAAYAFAALVHGRTCHAAEATQSKAESVASGISVEGRPKWALEVPLDTVPSGVHGAQHIALSDHQTRVDRDGEVRYVHKIRVIDEAAGLVAGSQIQVDFDPQYQKLAFHTMFIVREGRRLERLDRKKIVVLHREPHLEAQMYDGRMTASRVLEDVRVGDRIEWSYSLRGANPVFQNRFVEVDWAASSTEAIDLYQYRLLAPETRTIACKAGGDDFEITSHVQAGVRETIVRRRDTRQTTIEVNTPARAYLPDLLSWSEFTDWGDVARWAQNLFEKAQVASPELAVEVERIRAQGGSPDEQARHALDFVQTQVRYFGTEIGEYSHQPAPPSHVLQQRYGDCKDKVTLLIAMLHALKIGAEPVLVSTYYRDAIDRMLPSPLAFNHVIARVDVNGKQLWLDGTRAYQTGALEGRSVLGYGKGLVAASGAASATALADLPSAEHETRVSAELVLRVENFAEDPELEAHITYFGELAEIVRSALANRPVDEMGKHVTGEFARAYPGLLESGDMEVTEDPQRNELSLGLRYQLKDYWKYPDQQKLVGNFSFVQLVEALRLPTEAPRIHAIQAALPGVYRETVSVVFPEDIFGKSGPNTFKEQSKFFSLRVHQEGTARSLYSQGELDVSKEIVEASEWGEYLAQINRDWPHMGGSLTLATLRPDQLEKLKKDTETLSEQTRKGQVKVATLMQGKARLTILSTSAQLASVRLNSKFRALLLAQRGIAHENLGEFAAAAADFAEAKVLDPGCVDAYLGAALNAMDTNAGQRVDEEVAKALELAPSNVAPRYTRMYAHYDRGMYREAQDDARELLENPDEVERSYAALLLYLSARRLGDADGVLSGHFPSGSAPDWPYPVLEFLANKITLEKAIKESIDSGHASPEKLCELYYYAGERELLNGDTDKAKEYLRKSVATSVSEYREFILAKHELDRISAR
jgi:lipoprotein NlpI/transglutaminase-like putative cysteine protease